jgi:hypothetical protein
MTLWEFFIYMFWFYILFSCIVIVIQIFIDIFSDHSIGGGSKALWVIFLVFVPFLAALIYLVVRGRGMAERRMAKLAARQGSDVAYIQSVASTSSTADEITKAKGLLDSGAITQAEYDTLKASALA